MVYIRGEILVIVDRATRETILRSLKDQKQDKVARVVIDAIIYNRGVPDFIRSDNAPQLMQGTCRDVCTYLARHSTNRYGRSQPKRELHL